VQTLDQDIQEDSQQADSSAAVPDQLPPGAGSSGQVVVRKPWRPPGPNDTALSTMHGHPGQPGQRGRPGFYEFTDVRLQNRTVWVFSGARVPRAPELQARNSTPWLEAKPALAANCFECRQDHRMLHCEHCQGRVIGSTVFAPLTA